MSKDISCWLVCEKCYHKDMIYFLFLFLEIAIMFLLSQAMGKALSRFMSISFLSFVLLPGVIIHELSHMLIAAILLVPVGDMEFSPKTSPNGIKLGSIEIGKTDPIRRSVIGFAPVLVGTALILGLIYFASNDSIVQTIELNTLFGIGIVILMFYFLFVISSTMFSSKKDMEGTAEILITMLIILAVAYVLGFRPPLDFIEKTLTREVIEVVRKSSLFLLAPIAIDLFILGTAAIFTKKDLRFKLRL